MLRTRIIPCLLLEDEGLVKTKKFSSPKYIGDPINAVKIFNDLFVDELILLDIAASKSQREPNFDLIQDIASESFIPFSYGGGVSTLEHARKLFALGVEKVIINSAILYDAQLLRMVADEFGIQSVVASVDVVRTLFGGYSVFDHCRGKKVEIGLSEYIKQLLSVGVGEIFINNVSRDGTRQGFDNELIGRVMSEAGVPVIACGGAASLEGVAETVERTGVAAVAAGSLFVYHGKHNAVLINYPDYQKLLSLFT